MKHKIKKLKDSQVEIKIELSPEEFNEFKEEAALNLKKDFQIKGFRKGKVPKEIVQKEIGQGKILEEAAQLAVEQSYLKCILREKIKPISSPQVKILNFPVPHRIHSPVLPSEASRADAGATGNPFVFSATVQVLPEIKLPDYIEIAKKIKRRKILVGEDEIEGVVKQLQLSRAKLTTKEGAAERGDFVQIEYSCPQIEEGKKFQDGFVLGKGFFIPGFEENLIATKASQEKEFSLRAPKDYFRKDLVGKDLTFKVIVKGVHNVELPEINDDFAEGLGKFQNPSALKKSIEKGLQIEKEIFESQRIRREMLDNIRDSSEISLPQALIEEERDYLAEEFKKLPSFSISGENKERKVSESLLSLAEKRIKNSLIIREISEKEGLSATEEEIKEEINRVLKQHSDLEKFNSVKSKSSGANSVSQGAGRSSNGIDLDLLRSYAKGAIIEEKVFQFLESLNTHNT